MPTPDEWKDLPNGRRASTCVAAMVLVLVATATADPWRALGNGCCRLGDASGGGSDKYTIYGVRVAARVRAVSPAAASSHGNVCTFVC